MAKHLAFNRTSMESKQVVILELDVERNELLIEPVWNRNCCLYHSRQFQAQKLLIEPVWNRNTAEESIGLDLDGDLLIEPVWNRNCR